MLVIRNPVSMWDFIASRAPKGMLWGMLQSLPMQLLEWDLMLCSVLFHTHTAEVIPATSECWQLPLKSHVRSAELPEIVLSQSNSQEPAIPGSCGHLKYAILKDLHSLNLQGWSDTVPVPLIVLEQTVCSLQSKLMN